MNAVDTNVLIYAHDQRDPLKQAQAVNLIASLTDGVLLWQVACEYIAASRKLAAYGLSQQQAWQHLQNLRGVWPLVLPSAAALDEAEKLTLRGNLSWWDALLVAACLANDVITLYSEDFDSSTTPLTGVKIINPFTSAP